MNLFPIQLWVIAHVALGHGHMERIPRAELISPLDYVTVQLSFDGKWLAYVGVYEEVSNVFIYNLSNGDIKALTKDSGRGINRFDLSYDNETILYEQDNDGDENYNLYATNVNTEETRVISKIPGVQTIILDKSYKRPHEIVVGNNKRNLSYSDAYVMDLKSGEQRLLFENNFFTKMYFDEVLQLKIARNETSSASMTYFYFKNDGHVELIKHVSPFDQVETEPIRITDDGIIYWKDTENVDKAGLVSLNPQTKERQVLYFAKKADVLCVFFHPTTGKPLWLYEYYDKPELIILDKTYESDFKKILKITSPRSYIVVQMSLDGDKWLLEEVSDIKPTSYYIYDRTKSHDQIQFLFSAKEKLLKYNFSLTYAYDVVTTDGLVELCYLNIPPHFDNNGLPVKPLPTVLLVHGGPQGRDFWNFDPLFTQLYASRDYAVLRCQFRASTGFGKALASAGNGEWGRKMQDDLTDAVKWSIAMNITDPNKVAIVGASYGGYAVLAGVTFTPDVYTCGVAMSAPSNLITAASMIPEYWKPNLPTLNLQMCNDPSLVCNEEFLRSRSPLFFVDKIKVPLLIVQGEQDPRVDKFEAEQIVNALKNTTIPVTYARFPDEGHWMVRPTNLLAVLAITEQFLGQCLMGYSEPITDEIRNSSAIIETYNTIS